MEKSDSAIHKNFSTENGGNYVLKLEYNPADLLSILSYKLNSNFKIKQISEGRFLTGKAEYSGENVFFKVACPSPGNAISRRLENEIYFYQRFPQNSDLFELPKVLKSGKIDYNSHMLNFYLTGSLDLVSSQNNFSQRQKLTEITDFIANSGFISLIDRNSQSSNKLPVYIQKSELWLSEFLNASSFFEEKNRNSSFSELEIILPQALKCLKNWDLQLNFAHKDFSPRNIQINRETDKFVLLDAEHCGFAPRYYDQTYFLTRLWLENPEAGQNFFENFYEFETTKGESEKEFYKFFKPVLASRLIGVCWDQMQDKYNSSENLLNLARFWLKIEG